MKLGIFDSGMGGRALAASLTEVFPDSTIHVVDDRKNVPYGSKTTEQIITLTTQAIQPLLEEKSDIIIIACNTATMAAIETLRRIYPSQKFIGLEPMVKPAASISKTGVIAVCATPFTLASQRYAWLIKTYAKDTRIIQPDCSAWARMIENNTIDKKLITATIDDCCEQGADVIVLGCTHYHWIKNMVQEIAGNRAVVLEPSEAIARRIQDIAPHGTTTVSLAQTRTAPIAPSA